MGSKQTKCLFIYCLLRYSIHVVYECDCHVDMYRRTGL